MTKLLQWLCFLGLIFAIWISLLTDVLPITICKSVKDVVLPFPFYMVIVFGCYSLIVIGYRVLTFNDCEDAADSLRKRLPVRIVRPNGPYCSPVCNQQDILQSRCSEQKKVHTHKKPNIMQEIAEARKDLTKKGFKFD